MNTENIRSMAVVDASGAQLPAGPAASSGRGAGRPVNQVPAAHEIEARQHELQLALADWRGLSREGPTTTDPAKPTSTEDHAVANAINGNAVILAAASEEDVAASDGASVDGTEEAAINVSPAAGGGAPGNQGHAAADEEPGNMGGRPHDDLGGLSYTELTFRTPEPDSLHHSLGENLEITDALFERTAGSSGPAVSGDGDAPKGSGLVSSLQTFNDSQGSTGAEAPTDERSTDHNAPGGDAPVGDGSSSSGDPVPQQAAGGDAGNDSGADNGSAPRGDAPVGEGSDGNGDPTPQDVAGSEVDGDSGAGDGSAPGGDAPAGGGSDGTGDPAPQDVAGGGADSDSGAGDESAPGGDAPVGGGSSGSGDPAPLDVAGGDAGNAGGTGNGSALGGDAPVGGGSSGSGDPAPQDVAAGDAGNAGGTGNGSAPGGDAPVSDGSSGSGDPAPQDVAGGDSSNAGDAGNGSVSGGDTPVGNDVDDGSAFDAAFGGGASSADVGDNNGSGNAGAPAQSHNNGDHTPHVAMAASTKSGTAQAVLTVAEVGHMDHAYAKFMVVNKAGVIGPTDVKTGIEADPSAKFLVSLDHAGGKELSVSQLNLEGTGNIAAGGLKLDSVSGKNPLAYTAMVDPDGKHPIEQSATASTDGSSSANNISDKHAGSFDAIGGLGGNDSLSGSGDSDLLIGGSGRDKLHGGSGDDMLVYNSGEALMDGGAGVDILRIDDGARQLSLHSGLDHSLVDLSAHSLDGKIDGIEVLLITEEAIPDPDRGTTLKLTLGDVVDITGENHNPLLTILGNAGDQVDLGSGWTQHADAGGFHVYTQIVAGGGVATVRIEDDIKPVDIHAS